MPGFCARVSREVTRTSRGLVAAALLVVCAAAPVRAWQFRVYAGEDGLSQLNARTIVQDRDGFLWVATESGLDQFDGTRFRAFGPQDGVPDSRINALVADPDGGLWIGTGRGVARHDATGFHALPTTGLPATSITALARGPDGTLWVGTTAGLATWNGGAFVPQALPFTGEITAVAAGADGAVWAGARAGLARRAPGAGAFASWSGTRGRAVTGLATDAARGTWIAFDEAVVVTTPDGVPVREIPVLERFGVHAHAVAVHRDGSAWISTTNGAVRVVGAQEELINAAKGLPLEECGPVLEDREGILWFSGFGGVARTVGRAFTTYGKRDGLLTENVRAVVRDHDGRLWVASVRGVARFDGTRFTTFTARDGLSHDIVRALHVDRAGRVWAGTFGGLDVFDGARFHRAAGWSASGKVNEIAMDHADRLWVAGDFGVFRSDRAGRFARVEIPGLPLESPRVFVDSRGGVWIGGKGGLARWDGAAFTVWHRADGMAGDDPSNFGEDAQHNIWFAYWDHCGVTCFDGRAFRTYTTADGLSHDAVFALGRAADGAMWFGTARGADRFDGHTFRHYGTGDGYPSPESNGPRILGDPDGTVWFATAAGLAHYDPRLEEPRGLPVPVVLRNLRLGGREIRPDERVTAARHDLEVDVAALSYLNPGRLRIRYRIVGLSDAWSPLEGRHIAVAALPPGRFTLQVQAQRANEAWSPPAAFGFSVAPAWWQTAWFVGAAVAALVALFVAGIKLRVRRVVAHNLKLEHLVEERTRELGDANARLAETSRLKSAFLANMSHEIRTPMNAVIGMTGLLEETTLDAEQQDFVGTIRSSGEMLLALINDILDLSKIEAGRLEIERIAFDPRAALEDVLCQLVPRAREKGLELALIVDPRVPARVLGDPSRIRQIVLNLLGNALKFTNAGEVVLSVRRLEAPAGAEAVPLRIEVRDSGIGLTDEQRAHLFQPFVQADASTTRRFGGTGLGLSICHGLVQAMGGTIGVDSVPGSGSTFWFELPLGEAPAAISDPRDASLSGRRVLVVVGRAANRAGLVLQLEALGLVVDAAATAADAIARFAAGARFDAALVDYEIDGGGPDFARALGASRGPAKLVLLAWVGLRGQAAEARAAGYDAFLTFPVKTSVLDECLVRTLTGTPGEELVTRHTVLEQTGLRRLRVLLVDDNAVNQKLAAKMLDKMGCRTDVAVNGALAVAAFETHEYDVVLMDCQMPVMDGYEATRAIRQRETGTGRRVPVIALTASALAGERDRCLAAGMDDYLAKPFRKADLEALLDTWCCGAAL